MNVWLMPGDTVGSGDYQTFMAQLCATQIRDWLSAGQQGRALLWRGKPRARCRLGYYRAGAQPAGGGAGA
jgi:ATP-dependent exoDNAse (exonuclease V) beta subunit